jgi:predicted MFS family arabinose efflux permease
MPRRGFLVFGAMFFLMASSQSMFVTFGSWLEDEFGFTEAGIAGVAFALGAFELLASITSARRSDLWGKERSTIAGALLIVPSGVLLALLHTHQIPGLVLLGLFLLGFEFAIVSLLPVAANIIPTAPGRGLGIVLAGGMLGRASMSVIATSAYDRSGIEWPAIIGSISAVGMIACLAVFSRGSRS